METDLFEQAMLIWDNGEVLSSNPEYRCSLYKLDKNLYIMWFTKANILKKIQLVYLESALEINQELDD